MQTMKCVGGLCVLVTDTSIRISTENRQELKRLMPKYGETYDEVIATLIEETGLGDQV